MPAMTCDYCTCCVSNIQHIGDHYDPEGLTKPDENARELLAELQEQWGDECDLDLEDVQAYIDSRKSDETVDCIYCGASVPSCSVPSVDDEDAWTELAAEHADDCEWIRTRAHRLD